MGFTEDDEDEDEEMASSRSSQGAGSQSSSTQTASKRPTNETPVLDNFGTDMRRMKEMASIQGGMNFYGEMPDMFNLVLNSDHKLVKEVLSNEEQECATAIEPIEKEISEVENRLTELKDKQKDKKDEEIPTAEKDEVNDLTKKSEDLKQKKAEIYATYGAKNKVIRQLIDLALLQNGMFTPVRPGTL